MSKEVIKGSQFAHLKKDLQEDSLVLTQEQLTELQSLYDGALQQFKSGKIVHGKIIQITPDGVLVDIGYKSYGFIPDFQFTDFELKKLKQSDEIEVILDELEDIEGNVVLSYEKAKALRAWDSIVKMHEEGRPVEGIVTHKVRGGLSVDIGVPAFLPGSQVDVQRVTDFDQYVGQSITAHVIKVNQKRGNVIISRRKFLSEQRQESRRKVLENLKENDVIQGIVKNITNYGVFIDVGGVDGLLHITDMTWGRIAHPSELVKIGDKITVKIISFDKENEKISLGMKQLTENPWAQIPESLKIGSHITGKISSITDYGLFVEILPGVEGLVHISEISWTDRITDLHKHFKVGQEIKALVVSLDKDNRRMSLSLKQLEKNPWEEVGKQFQPGQRVKGKISNITDFGIFVQLIPGIDGLVHVSDLSWTAHVAHPADLYKKGQEVEAIVLGVDEENKRIALGIKQLTENPWQNIEEQYPAGSIVEGEVSKITNFGAFVKLPTGIEGLVHVSEFDGQNADDIARVLSIGQKHTFRVTKVSKEDQKVGLSMKLEASDAKEKKAREVKREKVVKKEKIEQPKMKSALQMELERLRSNKTE